MGARCVAVAFSGGRDSTALLHATIRAARALDVEVLALHVHHGLHADADAWLEHCARQCSRWARNGAPLRLAWVRLEGRPPKGDSVEAWAREARYRALSALAREHGATLVLLAQHRRDQAETFMLQALRGAGVAGLAAMPRLAERDGQQWARPWLGQPREAIEAYVRRHRLGFIDDGSNVDSRFARNRLRADVWPALASAFEHAESALAGAAASAAQADELLVEVAAQDLAALAQGRSLGIAGWRRLSSARRRNALLEWLRRGGAASAALLERLLRELPVAAAARWPAAGGIELRLYRGRLTIGAQPPAGDVTGPEDSLQIARPGSYPLPGWQGCLIVRRVQADGVAPALLGALLVTGRAGGERFQLAPHSTPRSLKKQFQALGVPAWQRSGPLLFAGGRLLFVPGLGIDARLRARPGEEQFDLRWQPDVRR